MTLRMLHRDGSTTSFVYPGSSQSGLDACLLIGLSACSDGERGKWQAWAATVDIGGIFVGFVPGCSPDPLR